MEHNERLTIISSQQVSEETRLAVLEVKVSHMEESHSKELKRFTVTQKTHHDQYTRINNDSNLLRLDVANISERQLQQIEENKEIRRVIESNTEVIKSFETFLIRYTQEKETTKSNMHIVASAAKSITWIGGIIGMIYAAYRVIKGE